MRKLPIIAFVILACVLGVALTEREQPKQTGGVTDQPFPNFTLSSLDGTTQWDSAKLKGHVTVINFFASWCAPCTEEMPQIAALKQQFPDVHFEGVAWNDDPDTLKKWLDKNGNPFNIIWYDVKGNATIALGIKGIPETFVIDGDGKLRYRLEGPLTAELRAGEFGMLLTALQNAAQLQGITRGL